jgi:nucleotide-binding universal stress UspA family protein/CBS domain-containing protein
MTEIKKILCPVDLSDNSLATIDMASTLAKANQAELVFMYIEPQWLPQQSMLAGEYFEATITEDKEALFSLKPADESIGYDHVFVHGNPGPEIVREGKSCDLIIMSTHGYSGISRFLMGSVAEYVVRHATCPVMTIKSGTLKVAKKPEEAPAKKFVTDVMRHVKPIRRSDDIADVVSELDQADQTAAPVIDELGNCIGILTKTDIVKYRELQERFEKHDESVIEEMFETDKYGQRRTPNLDFVKVHRHMSSPVITIANTQSCEQAQETFANNPTIHHLIVVDESSKPIGILETGDVAAGQGNSQSMSSGR